MAKSKVLVEFQLVQKGKNFAILQKEQEKHNKTLDQTDKKTKNLNKSQANNYNRQKQGVIQTANSTKNFSKLSQTVGGDGGGPGGLVRAYALLAANVFALTAAFGVLSRSAQIDTLNQSMEVLSTTGGTYIKNLAKDMQEASGFAIDLAQSFRQVSLAASAGLNTSEIEGLTKVAKGAAISLGRNLPDAMDRIFRGAIKLEPEILDEIGLFVRVDEAAQKYARNNGKVVSALTQVEKRQAFLNEILEQGTKKFAQYADEIKPDPYVRLGAALGDIAQSGLSLLNNVLGPVLSYLAESKILLSAVFGALVFALLKKAIPAMGLMTQQTATLAQERANAAREYAEGVSNTAKKNIAVEEKGLVKSRKIMKQKQRDQKRFQSRASKQPDMAKFDKEKLGSLKRKKLLEERITLLKKAQNDSGSKNQTLIAQELEMLKEEERIEQRLSNLRKQTGVDKGSLADRRQQQLDRKAGGTSIIATATGIGETSGMKEGWKNLTEEIGKGYDTLDEKGNKVNKQFTGLQKAGLKAQGGMSLLAGGISKAMMVIGPFMMILGLLAPLLALIGKWMGFGRKEAVAYGESLERLGDQTENLNKRFKTQTEQLRRGDLSWVESIKAQLAFNKGQKETMENLLKVDEAFKEVQRTMGFFTGLWDKISGRILTGLKGAPIQIMGRAESNRQLAIIEAGTKNMVGAFRGANESLQQIYLDGVEGSVHVKQAVDNLVVSEDALYNTKEAYYKLIKDGDEGSKKRLEDIQTIEAGGMKTGYIRNAFKKELAKEGADAELDYVLAMEEKEKMDKRLLKSGKKLVHNADTYKNISKDIIKQMDIEIKLLERLASAATGASESIGKFQQAFMPKTKVDDVLSSFKQFESAFADIKKKGKDGFIDPELASGFFEKFADSDNAFGSLFKSLFKAVTKDGVTTMELIDKTGDAAAEAFTNVRKVLDHFRDGILTTKVEIQSLKAEQKMLTKLTMGGLEVNTQRQKKFTEELKKTYKVQRQLTSVAFVSFGLGVEEAGEAAKLLAKQEDIGAKRLVLQELLNAEKLTENQYSQANAYIEQEEMKRIDYLVAVEQESLLIKKEGLQAQQKINAAQKEYSNAKRAELEVEATISALKTRGTAKLDPAAQAALDIDAATRKRDLVIEESKIKLLLLDVEEKLLLARIDVLEREEKLVGVNVGALKSNVQRATSLQKSALSTLISNATAQVAVDLAASTSKAFGGGLVSGAMAGTKALRIGLEDIEKRRKKAVSDAVDASNAGGGTFKEGIVAGVDAGKPFIEEEAVLRQTQAMNILRESVLGTVEALNKLGPDGVAAGAFLEGTMTIMDGAVMMSTEFMKLDEASRNGLEGMALQAQFAATAISSVGSIMAANSQAQIAEIDKQIEAEKKRDGKSAASVARMKALEAKKEAIARKSFNTQKKVQMATVAINTAAAIMQVMSAPGDPYKLFGIPMSYYIGALGAMQLAMIAKTSYAGAGSAVEAAAKPTSLSIGGRGSKVDVSQRAGAGELSYLRGDRGTGSNANNFRTGGATGIRSYAAGQEVMVGEQGPERIDIIPNEDLGRTTGTTNINFSISAVDGQSVQNMLQDQQGNIISMIRAAANDNGESFLENVDSDVYGSASTGGG